MTCEQLSNITFLFGILLGVFSLITTIEDLDRWYNTVAMKVRPSSNKTNFKDEYQTDSNIGCGERLRALLLLILSFPFMVLYILWQTLARLWQRDLWICVASGLLQKWRLFFVFVALMSILLSIIFWQRCGGLNTPLG